MDQAFRAAHDAGAVARSWHQDGYVVLPGLLDGASVAELLAAVQGAEPLDPGANALTDGAMEFRSNLFHRSAALRAALADPRIVEVVTAVLGPDVWCRWDQAVRKGPGAGWFPWHQDNGYTGLDNVHLQLWIALTPSHAENGGLRIVPGLHRSLLPHVWQGGHARVDPADPRLDQDHDGIPIDAEPGDAIAFSSLLPHATAPNLTDVDRWAYVAEFLPIGVADRTVPTPHFVVARGGVAAPELVDLGPGWDESAGSVRMRTDGPAQ